MSLVGSQLESTAIFQCWAFHKRSAQETSSLRSWRGSLMKCMLEPFIIKEDGKSKAIRNPDLNSCCDSSCSFPQEHHQCQGIHSLSWSCSWGLSVLPCLLEGPRCQKGGTQGASELNTLPEEAPCTSRTPPASTAGLLAEASIAQEGKQGGHKASLQSSEVVADWPVPTVKQQGSPSEKGHLGTSQLSVWCD